MDKVLFGFEWCEIWEMRDGDSRIRERYYTVLRWSGMLPSALACWQCKALVYDLFHPRA